MLWPGSGILWRYLFRICISHNSPLGLWPVSTHKFRKIALDLFRALINDLPISLSNGHICYLEDIQVGVESPRRSR